MQSEKRTSLFHDVKFRKTYARQNTPAILKNVSLSGAFMVYADTKLQAGDKVSIVLQISGRERNLQAQIIWSNERGSGLKFIPHTQRDVQIIDDLIYFVEEKKIDQKEILGDILKKVA